MGLKSRFGLSEAPADEPVDSATTTGADGAVHIDVDNQLRNFRKQHKWDPFLDNDKLETLDTVIESGDIEKEAVVDESLIQDDSPYPEVRTAVPPTDEDVPASTVRSWTLGFLLCTIVTACNVLLGLRLSPIIISSTVVQLIAYPLGTFWAKVMPAKSFHVFGREFSLNPGPFNKKEHTLIAIMTAAGSQPSYAINILLAQEVFYQQFFKWGFQILLIISTQAMGFGLAGIARRFLVWPSSMVWPANLVFTSVIHSLHNHQPSDPSASNGWKISRYRFFLIVALGTFAWEWFPLVIAPFLSLFIWPVWIAPNNVVVNQIFGGQTGLGLIPMSFDWGTISAFLLSPLQTPAFAILNVGAGILFMMIGIIGLAWAGPEFYRYLPLSANANFDNMALPYNTSRILTPEFTINMTAYHEYSPILLGPAFSLGYGMGFATLVSTVVHVALFYGPDIWNRVRNARYDEPDIHERLMRKYKEAPEWWFMAIFAVSFAFGLASALAWDTHLPWWAFIVAILISLFFILPIGIIQAITNQQTGLNIITEMIFGYMLPGRPVAMMLFKSYGYITMANGLTFVSDMKIGHYMKIPPRDMFAAQSFAVIWLSIVQIATYNFLRGNIEGICTPEQSQGLTCPGARTFYNASVIWGAIGPRIVFGAGGIYSWVNYFWLIGAALPVIHFVLARRYPRSFLRFVYFPAIFGAAGLIPPATTWWLAQWVLVGLAFNWFIRSRWFGWWSRYNYVLSGALDIGTALTVTLVGIGLGVGNANFPDWWGTTVINNNLDANAAAVSKTLAPGAGPIGPSSW